jgi:hypothetical protein
MIGSLIRSDNNLDIIIHFPVCKKISASKKYFPLKIGTTLKIPRPILNSTTVKYIPKKEWASVSYRCPKE